MVKQIRERLNGNYKLVVTVLVGLILFIITNAITWVYARGVQSDENKKLISTNCQTLDGLNRRVETLESCNVKIAKQNVLVITALNRILPKVGAEPLPSRLLDQALE